MEDLTRQVPAIPQPPGRLRGIKYPYLHAPFGFKVVEIDGEPMWTLATEDEYLDAQSNRLGLPREEIKKPRCRNSGPMACHPDGCCTLFYDDGHHMYYCDC